VSEFLNYLNTKPLYYKHIDHARIHKAYALVESHIKHPKTIHIVGTNGKGSTGRTLAHLIFQSGQSVITTAHRIFYTSMNAFGSMALQAVMRHSIKPIKSFGNY